MYDIGCMMYALPFYTLYHTLYMDFYLIRHTEVAVGRSVCYGHTDVALADNYVQQRDRLRQHLPETSRYVFSSPLSRCRLLAGDLAGNVAVQYDDRLREYHFGDWEGLPWADIPPDALTPWMADFVNVAPPNGETFQQFSERVVACWYERLAPLADAPDAGPALIITHGGVVRALLCLFLDLSLQNAYRLHLDYGAVTKLSLHGGHYQIQYINR